MDFNTKSPFLKSGLIAARVQCSALACAVALKLTAEQGGNRWTLVAVGSLTAIPFALQLFSEDE
jgi:hypothetical protein